MSVSLQAQPAKASFSPLSPPHSVSTPHSQLTSFLASSYRERSHPEGTRFNPNTPQVRRATAGRIHKVLRVPHRRPRIPCGVRSGPSLPAMKQRPTDSSSPTTRTNTIAISPPSRSMPSRYALTLPAPSQRAEAPPLLLLLMRYQCQ